MRQVSPEVFTLDELALASGVSKRLARELAAAGEVRFIPGTRFLTRGHAVEAGRRLQVVAREKTPAIAEAPLFGSQPGGSVFSERRKGLPAFASSFVHAALIGLILWAFSAPAGTSAEPADEKVRLVFLLTPGPGGGGGGGGTRSPLPAPRIERRGTERAQIPVPKTNPEPVLASRPVEEAPPKRAPLPEPKPVEREPDPLPSAAIIAPVAAVAASTKDREGVVEKPRGNQESQGAGTGGGAGTGQGTGNGEGLGSGLGDGAGGGTGGGPYRPGSGIEPPRLLREIKADYTEEARRRGLTGDVILEIVVRRDGTVGDVSLLRGIGSGLDQRAIAAVRQWRFTPARKQGQPVDVIVEVAVEFTLR
jgi:periplasmic protein TonB